MDVRVLGDLEVVRDGVVVPLGGPKPRALVGVLVAARGRTVGTERLVSQLWGECPPPTVLTTLQAYVARLRSGLEPDRGARARPSVLVTRAAGYALLVPDGGVDSHRFEQLVTAACATSEPAGAERLAGEALRLWRGCPYSGLTEAPVLAAEAARLEELRLRALEQLWSARLRRGRHGEAVPELTALVAEHTSRERLWAMLVLALYRGGRQSEALDALRRVRVHLADELGIDPGAELRRLETAVLRQDPELLSPDGGTGDLRDQGDAPGVADPGDRNGSADDLPGRTALLAGTRQLVAAAAAGSGRVLLVTGEPGIGKTRFAQAVAAQASAAGLRPAWGTWEADGCPPMWGWSQALGAEGAAVLHAAVDGRDSSSAIFHLADGVLARLAADGGTCAVLDDVQWADPDSLRLLRRLADLVASVPVLLVVLCRDPGAEVSPGVQGVLAAFARLGVERIRLPGLDADEVRALVRLVGGLSIDDATAERIRERTGGNPFSVHELVRLLVEKGGLSDPGSPAWQSVPQGVRDTVRHRLGGLPPTVREGVRAAAVLGRTADPDVLEALWDGDPAALDEALDAALAAGLLVEDEQFHGHDGPGGLRFAHALVRDAVYGDIAPSARRRLHARAAAAIERRRLGRLDQHAAALAEHYRLAGSAHARSAWLYAARAAAAATAAGALAEAARLLASASDLQAADPLADAREREALHVAWGTALRRSGRIAEAWPPLQLAAASALARGDAPAAADALLVVTENVLWSWRTAHEADEAAVDLWLRVLRALPLDDVGRRARILAALSVEVMHDPPGGRCGDWADEALALARRHDELDVRIDVLQVVLNPLRRPDLLPRRVAAADELVGLCVRRNDEPALAVALAKRALNHSALGRPDAALADLHRALALAERHRLAPALMVIHLGIAVLRQAAGDWAGSEEALRAAEAVQGSLSMAGAGIGLGVRATALFAQGRLGEAPSELRGVAVTHPGLRDLHALSLLCAGRLDEARRELGPWREQPELIWDYLWVSSAVARGLVWSRLGDVAAVADLRRQLEPFADRIADGAMAACFLGSVTHTLAELALAGGDPTAARAWAVQARDLHRRLGWPPWESLSEDVLQRASADLARLSGRRAPSTGGRSTRT